MYREMMAQLLHAVAFGKAETDGNDGFSAEQYIIQTTDEATFEEVLEAYKACCLTENEEELPTDCYPVGFWLLTQEHLSVAHMPFDGHMGSDSAFIQANKTSKRICQRLAVKTLVK